MSYTQSNMQNPVCEPSDAADTCFTKKSFISTNGCAELPESYSESQLVHIRDVIGNMAVSHHIKILSILKDNNESFSENKYGVHVNLSDVNVKTVHQIMSYISYIESQQTELDAVETIKTNIAKHFFNAGSKPT